MFTKAFDPPNKMYLGALKVDVPTALWLPLLHDDTECYDRFWDEAQSRFYVTT